MHHTCDTIAVYTFVHCFVPLNSDRYISFRLAKGQIKADKIDRKTLEKLYELYQDLKRVRG